MDKAVYMQGKKHVLKQRPDLRSDVTLWRLVQLKHGFLSVGYDEAQAQAAAEEGVQLALDWRSQFEVPQSSL
ncbi:hypothetical protein OFN32_39320, partial [Escherichia coli]|nr:hypothetical protein [Escherichia coli]